MVEKGKLTDQARGPRPLGLELVEITPILLGGDPTDPKNKTWLTRGQHFEVVRYWNRMIKQLREGKTR